MGKEDISKIISHSFLYTILIIQIFDTDDSLLNLQYILLVISIVLLLLYCHVGDGLKSKQRCQGLTLAALLYE